MREARANVSKWREMVNAEVRQMAEHSKNSDPSTVRNVDQAIKIVVAKESNKREIDESIDKVGTQSKEDRKSFVSMTVDMGIALCCRYNVTLYKEWMNWRRSRNDDGVDEMPAEKSRRIPRSLTRGSKNRNNGKSSKHCY